MKIHFFTAPFYFAFIWFRVQGSRGGFAANIYGAMPESGIQVTSHSRLLIPSY